MVEATSNVTGGAKRVFVVGNGMTRFLKPGKHSFDYPDLSKIAIQRALRDAAIGYEQIEQAFCGYCNGDATSGQRACYEVGISGIPIFNMNNNCATGSTALFLAAQAIKTNQSDCVLALGFEKMYVGSLQQFFPDRANPVAPLAAKAFEQRGKSKAPIAPLLFGNAGREHMEKYGSRPEHFAKIAEKNHRHSVNNPYSQFRDDYTLDQVMKSKEIYAPLTKL